MTYLIGNYVTDRYRRETAKTEFEIAAMQSDISRAVQVFENISGLMDRRLYRMRRLHDVFAGNIASDSLDERLRDYRTTLTEWNDNLNKFRALFSFYFSHTSDGASYEPAAKGPCANTFELIARDFATAHQELQKLIDKKNGGSVEKTQSLFNDLNRCLYLLDELMLSRIRSLRGAYKEKISSH